MSHFSKQAALCLALTLAGLGGLPKAARAQASYGQAPPQPCTSTASEGQSVDPSKVFVLPAVGPRCSIASMAIAVHNEGEFRPLYQEGGLTTPSEQIEALVTRIKSLAATKRRASADSEPLRLLIFAHGGMVSHEDAVRRAESTAPLMMADGYEPIFLIWNSDLTTAYFNRLCCVLNGTQSRRDTFVLAPARAVGDIVTGIARAPESFILQGIRFHDTVIDQKSLAYFLCDGDGWRSNVEKYLLEDPINPACAADNINRYQKTVDQKGGETVIYPPFRSWGDLNDRRHHVGGAEFVYELNTATRTVTTSLTGLGGSAWENMVRRERMAFEPPIDVAAAARRSIGACRTLTSPALVDRSNADGFNESGVFFMFFARLQCEFDQDDDLKALVERGRVSIDLYGHSMGALVGDEILQYFPRLPYRRIVYMAAATPIRDFVTAAAPVIGRRIAGRGVEPVRFYNLMLHPIAESHEVHAGGALPEGSLLEWVDEYFERARSPDGLMLGKWSNVRNQLLRFRGDQRLAMSFRIFPAQVAMRPATYPIEGKALEAECTRLKSVPQLPQRCHPVQHGDFDGYSFWRDRFLEGDLHDAPQLPDPTGTVGLP